MNTRNHTFYVDGASYIAHPESVEKVVKLRLPATIFIPFAHGSGRTQHGIGVTRVIISEYRFADEAGSRFDVELKGFPLTKAGQVDKRQAGTDFAWADGAYHYAWVNTAEDVDRLLAALPEDMKATMLDGTTIGFTKVQVGSELYRRVGPHS